MEIIKNIEKVEIFQEDFFLRKAILDVVEREKIIFNFCEMIFLCINKLVSEKYLKINV